MFLQGLMVWSWFQLLACRWAGAVIRFGFILEELFEFGLACIGRNLCCVYVHLICLSWSLLITLVVSLIGWVAVLFHSGVTKAFRLRVCMQSSAGSLSTASSSQDSLCVCALCFPNGMVFTEDTIDREFIVKYHNGGPTVHAKVTSGPAAV